MKQVVDPFDLTCRMPLKTHTGIGFAHTLTVIDYLHQLFAGICNDKLDMGSASINRIFKQLFLPHSPAAVLLHLPQSGWQYYRAIIE